jgi:hypothetical protein
MYDPGVSLPSFETLRSSEHHEQSSNSGLSCAAGLASAAFTVTFAAQGGSIAWNVPRELSRADRNANLAIARAVGIRDAQTVSVPFKSACLLVEVESRPVVVGNRVLSDVVAVRQKRGPQCTPPSIHANVRVQRRGNWITSASNPDRRERWRICDGDWHVDVHLGANVP